HIGALYNFYLRSCLISKNYRISGTNAHKNAISRAIIKNRNFISLTQEAKKYQTFKILLQLIIGVDSRAKKNS
ncbi:hypothetical protein ACQXW1_17865, partial [Lactiplantibacillus pentosus]